MISGIQPLKFSVGYRDSPSMRSICVNWLFPAENFDDYSDSTLKFFIGYGNSSSMRSICVNLLCLAETFDDSSDSTPKTFLILDKRTPHL